MDITKLEIVNFLTIGEATLELDGRGLLLIQGENQDDTSAKSNGAGKSSIVDALCWAIYGVTARDVTADAVVNITTKKNCCVNVILQDGADRYRITRYRKDATYKNQVIVHKMNGASGSTDMSKGTDRETQEVINAIIGCSLDVFVASVYAGQEKMPNLPGMTDKQLKVLIEEAAGVEELTAAYTVARGRHTILKTKMESHFATRSHQAAAEVAAGVELGALNDSTTEFESDRKNKAKTELAKALPLKQQLAEYEAEVAANPEAPLIAQIEALSEKLKQSAVEDDEWNAMNVVTLKAQKEVSRLTARFDIGKRTFAAAEKALAGIDDKVGDPCGECGKVYREEDLKAAAALATLAVETAKSELRIEAVALKAANEACLAASDAATKFKAAMTDFSAVVTLQRDLSNRLSATRLVCRSIDSKKKEIEAVSSVAKQKLTEVNPWTKAVETKTQEIERLNKSVAELTGVIDALASEGDLLESAVKVFGPAGVRAHILDTVTPYLNDRTQEYLGALSDGNIHATWNTLSKNAKGELKEKFNIDVVNDLGADSFAGLSGGEKRKVRISTAMALQDMVASRAMKPIGVFMADEIDDALDEPGLERLMGVLERKAKERGTVLVISHNSLSDWIDSVITVTKKGGLATVEGATAHGF
jgi:DNA repair exonuclease SbcCD ATPase subunit